MEFEKSQFKTEYLIFVTLESNASTWEHRVSNFSQLQIEALLATVLLLKCSFCPVSKCLVSVILLDTDEVKLQNSHMQEAAAL